MPIDLYRAQVALGYKQLPNSEIEKLPIPQLQKNGFIFIWVINARYSFAIELMEKWGYEYISLSLSHTHIFILFIENEIFSHFSHS
jgi:N6-adenosine-specific RNA methylase IME4